MRVEMKHIGPRSETGIIGGLAVLWKDILLPFHIGQLGLCQHKDG